MLVETNFRVVSSIRKLRELIRKKCALEGSSAKKLVEPCVLEGSSASRLNFVYLESTKQNK